MIPATLRVTLIAAVICYFVIILYFLKQKALNLKYTLLWLVAGLVMGILVAVPELLVRIIHIFGIQDNMNGLFIFAIGFIIMILLSLTSIASRQRGAIGLTALSFAERVLRDGVQHAGSASAGGSVTALENHGYGAGPAKFRRPLCEPGVYETMPVYRAD